MRKNSSGLHQLFALASGKTLAIRRRRRGVREDEEYENLHVLGMGMDRAKERPRAGETLPLRPAARPERDDDGQARHLVGVGACAGGVSFGLARALVGGAATRGVAAARRNPTAHPRRRCRRRRRRVERAWRGKAAAATERDAADRVAPAAAASQAWARCSGWPYI